MGDSPHAVQPPAVPQRLDHLLFATPDVDASVEALAGRLGVRAMAGGRHPAWGTRNALLALGSRSYLEIIGPDPESPAPTDPRPAGIDELRSPRLATWAAATSQLDRDVAKALAAGVDLGASQTGSRRSADGSLLSWRMSSILAPRLGGIVPFLLDWGASPHPGAASPAGCMLVSLRAEHPEPEPVRRALEALGLELTIAPGPAPRLIARLATPRGEVELG